MHNQWYDISCATLYILPYQYKKVKCEPSEPSV